MATWRSNHVTQVVRLAVIREVVGAVVQWVTIKVTDHHAWSWARTEKCLSHKHMYVTGLLVTAVVQGDREIWSVAAGRWSQHARSAPDVAADTAVVTHLVSRESLNRAPLLVLHVTDATQMLRD